MNEILITNIFFIITGTAVVLLTIMWMVILFQVWKISKQINKITHAFSDEAIAIGKVVTRTRKKITKKILGEE
ncbi:MAG: hypothetical protein WCG20_03825 [bacterium]